MQFSHTNINKQATNKDYMAFGATKKLHHPNVFVCDGVEIFENRALTANLTAQDLIDNKNYFLTQHQ